jgi:predicted ATPase
MKIKKIKFLKDFRSFKEGEVIDFAIRYQNQEDKEIVDIPETIPIVGLNGSGKTTLLHLIADFFDATMSAFGGLQYRYRGKDIIDVKYEGEPKVRLFEAEKDSKRGGPAFDWDDKDIDTGFHIWSFSKSHGETIIQALCLLISKLDESGYNLLLLDEPDQALSVQLASILGKMFLSFSTKHPGVQIITAVHHPIVMEELKMIYSLKDKKYRWYKDVIKEMRETPLGETE